MKVFFLLKWKKKKFSSCAISHFFLFMKKVAVSIFSYWRSVWISVCKATDRKSVV